VRRAAESWTCRLAEGRADPKVGAKVLARCLPGWIYRTIRRVRLPMAIRRSHATRLGTQARPPLDGPARSYSNDFASSASTSAEKLGNSVDMGTALIWAMRFPIEVAVLVGHPLSRSCSQGGVRLRAERKTQVSPFLWTALLGTCGSRQPHSNMPRWENRSNRYRRGHGRHWQERGGLPGAEPETRVLQTQRGESVQETSRAGESG